jgi:hypothetical protein
MTDAELDEALRFARHVIADDSYGMGCLAAENLGHVERLVAEVRRLRGEARGWIDADSRLPERSLDVLVSLAADAEVGAETSVARWQPGTYDHTDWVDQLLAPDHGRRVTHWMPLPDPAG